ncbi:MAG: FecR family protein [Eudoraea sp.]|nr:FecR family protein [Eudoraea sp.]MBT8223177.1 FecR family protein [Eudoraea sp.]NNJ41685.1 FecR family protein [Eudoraea sp.]
MNKDELIKKWLADELSPEEASAFESLEDASFLKDIITDASAFKASHFSKPEDYQIFKDRLRDRDSRSKKVIWIKPLLRIASVFLIGFALYYFLWPNNLTEINTQFGEQLVVALPDESSVRVNAQSEIVFNEKKWASNREVKLEGEAFFDVVKGGRFQVVTPEGEITVLGTEFNVKQRGSFFEVKCYEGRVQVNSGDHMVILEVGDNFRSANGEISTGKNSFNTPQWTRNISNFQRIAVSEVFAELERQYGVEIIIEEINTDQLFTGGFVHDNLDKALKSITEPLQLDYKIITTDKVRVRPREK